jgi:hypothetical protein
MEAQYQVAVADRDGQYGTAKLCVGHAQAAWECGPDLRVQRLDLKEQGVDRVEYGRQEFERLTPPEMRDKRWEDLRDRLCDPKRTDFVAHRLAARSTPPVESPPLSRRLQHRNEIELGG